MTTKAIEVINESSGLSLDDPQQFEKALVLEGQRRQLLGAYIKDNLRDGVDYGTITIKGKQSKPCLFKSGSEKFISLLNLKPEFKVDDETLEILPDGIKEAGVVAYICILRHRKSGEVIAEGRGACQLAEKYGNLNNAVKIGLKRAQMDAVLRLGLSDTFTQDLDDMSTAPISNTSKKEDTAKMTAILQEIDTLAETRELDDNGLAYIKKVGAMSYEKMVECRDKLLKLPKKDAFSTPQETK